MTTEPTASSIDGPDRVDGPGRADDPGVDPREYLVPGELYAALAVAAGQTPGWHLDALCAQADPEVFFPEKGGSAREAQRVCRRCPVREQCLAEAIAHDERFGVWGGVGTRTQRRTLAAAVDPAEPLEGRPETGDDGRTSRNVSGGEPGPQASAPVPRGRAALDGMAARLPTGSRPARFLRRGPRSTFPDRARRTPASSKAGGTVGAVAAPHTPARTRRRELEPGTATVTALRRGTTSRTSAAGAAAPTGPPSDPAAAGEVGDDVAAPGTTRIADPPDHGAPDDDLAAAIAAVLNGHTRAVGSQRCPEVDPARVRTLSGGQSEPVGEAELRVAAVALVVSGTATRGQTARRFGVRSQDVAHWVARHQQGIGLIETSERSPR